MVNVRSSLKQGGKLLIDMMGKEILAKILIGNSWFEKAGVIYLEERRIEDGWEMIDAKCTVIKNGKKTVHTFRHRIYSGVELSILSRDIGFKSVKLYGDSKGSPYDNTATRLVALALK